MSTSTAGNNNKPTKPACSPLQLAYDDAHDRREDLESARARERHETLAEYTAALDRKLEETYGEQIRIAREEEARTHAAWMQEKEQEALTRQYPYPLGTVMVEWKLPRYSYGREASRGARSFTGRRGVLEVITSTSEHPSNQADYRRAQVGALVIRLLKKDRTPSKMYEHRQWEMRHRWVPEGTDLTQADLSWPEVGEGTPTTLTAEDV